jgi:RNA ligase (TIGR02306 family)
MSAFVVPVKSVLAIEPHPNADAIEFVVIDGWRSIAKKGEYRPGDLVVYIPEGALVPHWMLKRLGLWDSVKDCGKLAGKDGDRVKAVRIRGELSQGLCYPVKYAKHAIDSGDPLREEAAPFHYVEVDKSVFGVSRFVVRQGDDVAQLLGIRKYEPPVPVAMAGEVFNAGQHLTLHFDVENWKSFPDVLQENEEVVFTEKLHGTCTVVAILPYKDAHPEAFGRRKNILVFSKGLGAQGLVFKNNERNASNLYVRVTQQLRQRIDQVLEADDIGPQVPYFILGETFGPGVQDLTYGDQQSFRVFAVATGYRGQQRYLDWDHVASELKERFGFDTVPVLYRGPFSVAAMRKHTDGKTVMGANHIREGIVMVPARERFDPRLGRVCLKSVSADYLTRKGGTEYN